MSDLTLEGIKKNYGSVQAVRGIDLHIPEGEFTVLVGPSGCGKSTLLRAIAGLEAIDGGNILIGGEKVTQKRPRDRDLAMVFQSYALYPFLSVEENIGFGLKARGTAPAETKRRVDEIAQMLDIGDYLQRRPRELSGGQRQRVAIGRALIRDARLYLFDEPLSNLDAKLRDGMRQEIKRLHKQFGRTFIYVTHDQIEAMTLADRVVLLREGRIEQEGAPLDLFERPKTLFAASFVGSPTVNLLPCRRDGHDLVLADNQRIPLTPAQQIAVPDTSERLLWGIRPEHFTLDAQSPRLNANFDLAQPTGSRLYASFVIAGQPVTAELETRDTPDLANQNWIGVHLADTLIIDATNERTLYPAL